MADVRGRVAAVVVSGIEYAVLANNIGGTNGKRLIETAQEVLARDVSVTDEEELKQIAESAVEDALKDIEFNTAKILGDFYTTVDSHLARRKAR